MDSGSVLVPLQMAFLHLWDKGGQPWEVEGERAKEELKVHMCTHRNIYVSMFTLCCCVLLAVWQISPYIGMSFNYL